MVRFNAEIIIFFSLLKYYCFYWQVVQRVCSNAFFSGILLAAVPGNDVVGEKKETDVNISN